MERCIEKLSHDFRFCLYPNGTAPSEVFSPDYNDSTWESVRVPHDWAANGTFEEHNDHSWRSIEQDGIVKKISHSGRTGGLPIVGCGVYRKWVSIAKEDAGKSVFLEFDGIMWESHIYVNGQHVFFNHFGYKSFCVDITDYVKPGEKNLIAVSASVYEDCSRWYPGAGIYRNVRLVLKDRTHIVYNGIWLRQLFVSADKASFLLTADWCGGNDVALQAEIVAPDGKIVTTVSCGITDGSLSEIFEIPSPARWDIDAPACYTAKVTLTDTSGIVLDNETVTFGVRTFRFTADDGFMLNNRRVKLNGVCMHHDLGSLGAALNIAALRRQLEKMQEMGVNAIRTSHNPPAPELLDLCDQMGFVVMDEFFDEWYTPKIENGYAKYFHEHAAQDAADIVRRDRNHPCVIMWSIGNEIPEQRLPDGWRAAKLLADTVRKNDPTRPITAGFDHPLEAFRHHVADFVDVAGFNYKPHLYTQIRAEYPDLPLFGSETASCISTRGVYKLPAVHENPPVKHDDLTINAYDLSAPPWANIVELEWEAQDDNPFVAGEFVWTGMDYLGEPSPYYNEWPSRSSHFGILDLAGLPKNRYYAYKARWTNKPVLHIFPHWNWEGMEGKNVPIHAFTNFPVVELFINGVSQGKRSFTTDNAIERYRLIWNDTIYTPGTVTAVAYDENGVIAAQTEVKTADKPCKLNLQAERSHIAADGEDLVYLIASVVDKNGTLCPHADNRLTFTVEGAGELLTTDAGDQRETESFARPDKKALAGYLVACVRASDTAGEIRITVSASGLESAETVVIAE